MFSAWAIFFMYRNLLVDAHSYCFLLLFQSVTGQFEVSELHHIKRIIKVYSTWEFSYIPDAFYILLHTALAMMFIYCRYNSRLHVP